jgi:hypothetical protein
MLRLLADGRMRGNWRLIGLPDDQAVRTRAQDAIYPICPTIETQAPVLESYSNECTESQET